MYYLPISLMTKFYVALANLSGLIILRTMSFWNALNDESHGSGNG
jgi:hypothetical protein